MKHRYYVCGCGMFTCPYCGGGLLRCLVCGGAEGELLLECPGKLLTYEEHYENYKVNMRRTSEPLDIVGIPQ